MCEPITMSTALTAAGLALSAGTAAYGAVSSSNAQKAQANAISQQNYATQQAQNAAFNQRMQASREQSDAQFTTSQREMTDRAAAAAAMRQAQMAALNRQNQTVTSENQTAEALRAQGDQRAQALLDATNRQAQDQSQQGFQDRAAALLASVQAPTATGPEATDPSGSGASTSSNDSVTKEATARRMGLAAANIRQYGQDIARVASYGEPLQNVEQAVMANKIGIMPAQNADQLLRAGAGVRLAPSQIAYRNATDYGGAVDAAIQARAQGENTYAGLKYGNSSEMADLGQSDATTAAANRYKQTVADAQWGQQVAGLISGLGNIAAYGAGRYGPDVLPGKQTITPNIDTTSKFS